MKTLPCLLASFLGLACNPSGTVAAEKPNIIVIYADDLGFGDLSCYGGQRVQTPHIDQLAKEGLRFVNGYASSATCTPSRFSLLTGRYAFRQQGSSVLPGDAALLIKPGTVTLPSLLKRAGYATAVIGKWHLGLGTNAGGQDWNGELKPGPPELGFDFSFIIPATPDRVPCVFVENHRVLNLDPADPIRVSYQQPLPGELAYKNSNPTQLKMTSNAGHNNTVINGIGRIGHMTGGRAALWQDEEIEDVLAKRAIDFIEKQKDHPFFLYYASHDIHVPRVPSPRFVGASGMGPRGDEIVEFDWAVGQILDAVHRDKLTNHTLVILSSDNGPVLDDGYNDNANELAGDHRPAGPLRAGKYSIFDGGTRVPFLVSWPGKIKPGVSEALVGQWDLLASFAALTGQKLGANDAPDSENVLAALLGTLPTGRQRLVEYDQRLERALREGEWKFILPGKTTDGLGPWTQFQIPAPGLLFNLSSDPGETNNLASMQPERAAAMAARLMEIETRRARQTAQDGRVTNNVDNGED